MNETTSSSAVDEAQMTRSDANIWKAKSDTAEYTAVKQRIVKAATELVEKKGISRLRFGELASKVGCVRSTLYRYFDSKDELLTAVVLGMVNDMVAEIMVQIADIKDNRARFVEGIFLTAAKTREDPHYQTMMAPENTRYLTHLAVQKIPKDLSPLIFAFMSDDSTGKSLLKEGVSIDDVSRWLIVQIISLAQFGPIGKTEEEQKAFIDKMIVSAFF